MEWDGNVGKMCDWSEVASDKRWENSEVTRPER